jgi:hypothetical protein
LFTQSGQNTLQPTGKEKKRAGESKIHSEVQWIFKQCFTEVLQERRQKGAGEKMEYRDLVLILFVAGRSEAVRRVGDTVGIKTVFSSRAL